MHLLQPLQKFLNSVRATEALSQTKSVSLFETIFIEIFGDLSMVVGECDDELRVVGRRHVSLESGCLSRWFQLRYLPALSKVMRTVREKHFKPRIAKVK